MYGAGTVDFNAKVREAIRLYTDKGYSKLPICMAKTSASLTGDPNIKGAPTGFRLVVNDIFLSAGAGFIVPVIGEISRMPGLVGIFFDLITLYHHLLFLVCQRDQQYTTSILTLKPEKLSDSSNL